MTLEQLWAILGPSSTVASIFGSMYAIGMAVEKHVSDTARNDFRDYLLSGRAYSDTLQLPAGIYTTFKRIFGDRHLSWTCLRRSAAISIFSIAALFLIAGFHNPNVFATLRYVILGDGFFGESARTFLVLWLFWAIALDYVILLKTRILLGLFEKRTSHWSGLYLLLFLSDAVLSYALFGFGSAILTEIIASDLDRVFSNFWVTFTDFFRTDVVDLLFEPTGYGPLILALLIASALPSLWFWIWVLAALLGRITGSLLPVLKFAGYALPVAEKPFLATSITAGVIGCVFYLAARLVFG